MTANKFFRFTTQNHTAVKFDASMKVAKYEKGCRCKKDVWKEILKPAFKKPL